MTAIGDTYIPWRKFQGSLVPNTVLRCRDLSQSSKLIFGRLCQYAGENGESYPSYKTLGREVGIDRRQAIKAVKELETFGLILPVDRFGPDGGSKSNNYVFLWHKIFIEEKPFPPGVKNYTRESATNVTPPECQPRHRGVSQTAPKKNQTREKIIEETTTEQIRLLFLDTPFSKTTDTELNVLISRHGMVLLASAADIAAETWRRNHEDIQSLGGYLQSLCNDLIVPAWYHSPEERKANNLAIEKRRLAIIKAQEDETAAKEKETLALEDHWGSITEIERGSFIAAASASLPSVYELPPHIIAIIAKSNAWNQFILPSSDRTP